MVLYNTQKHLVFALCQSSGILKWLENKTFRKLNLFPSSPVFKIWDVAARRREKWSYNYCMLRFLCFLQCQKPRFIPTQNYTHKKRNKEQDWNCRNVILAECSRLHKERQNMKPWNYNVQITMEMLRRKNGRQTDCEGNANTPKVEMERWAYSSRRRIGPYVDYSIKVKPMLMTTELHLKLMYPSECKVGDLLMTALESLARNIGSPNS